MAAIANIVVKKTDDTTDITYDARSGAQDGSWAFWRQDTGAAAGLPIGMRALFKLKSLWNGPQTARKHFARYERPYAVLNASTGRYEVKDTLVIEMSATVPQGMPASEISEGVAQGLRCIDAPQVRTTLFAGYTPT